MMICSLLFHVYDSCVLCSLYAVGVSGLQQLNKIRNYSKQEHSYLASFLLSLKIDLETNKIMDFFKFDVGNVVMVTGGRNTGRVGVIKNWEKHKGSFKVIDVLLGDFCMLCLVFSYLLYRKT
jgi:hypothetical protein